MVVLISPRRDQTLPEWFALQEAAPLGEPCGHPSSSCDIAQWLGLTAKPIHYSPGRLSFLLACDLADAAAGVGAVLAVVKDDGRRQRQNEWFLEASL